MTMFIVLRLSMRRATETINFFGITGNLWDCYWNWKKGSGWSKIDESRGGD
jgi:hypothetical protein